MVTNTLIDINEMIDKPNIYTKQSETVICVGYFFVPSSYIWI